MADNVIGIKFGVAGGESLSGESGALIKKQLESIAEKIGKNLSVKININEKHFSQQLTALQKEIQKKLGNLEIVIKTKEKPVAEKGDSSIVGSATKNLYKSLYQAQDRLQDLSQKGKRNSIKGVIAAEDVKDANKALERHIELSGQLSEEAESLKSKLQSAYESQTYNDTVKALEKWYSAKNRLQKLEISGNKDTIDWVNTSRQVKSLEADYENQKKILVGVVGESDKLVNSINQQKIELEKVIETQKKTANSNQMATAIQELALRWQSLYRDNGYDKVVARSTEAKAIVDEFNASIQEALNQRGGNTKEQIEELNSQFIQVETKLKRIGVETDTVGNKIKEAFGSKIMQRISQVLLLAVVRSLKQVYSNVKAINTAMTELKIVTSATPKQMEVAANNIANSARKIGVSISDLTNSTTVYARLGYSLKDAQTLAEKTTMYANVAGISVSDATTNITGVIKAFNIGADGVGTVLDKLIWVGNKFHMSQAEIGEAMNNAASSLAANGNSLEEAIGIVSAANATLQDVSKSSTAVRAIAARISASIAELNELGENIDDVETFPNLAKKMRAYGVEITDTNGQLISTYEILGKVADKWETYDQKKKSEIATMIAGTSQQSAFYSIMQNWGDAQTIVAQSSNANGSLMEAQENKLDSIEGKFQQLKVIWESFSQNVLNSGVVIFFIDMISKVAEALNAISGFTKGALPLIIIFSTAIVGLGVVFTMFGNVVKNTLAKIGLSFKQLLTQSAILAVIGTIISLITLFEGKVKGTAEIVTGVLAAITAAVVMAIRAIGAAISGFMSNNPVGWILALVAGIALAIKGIYDLVKACIPSTEDLGNAAKEMKKEYQEANDVLSETKDKLQDICDQIDELNSKENKTIVDEEQLKYLEQERAQLEAIEKQQEDVAKAKAKESAIASQTAIEALKGKVKNGQKDNTGWAVAVGFLTAGIGNAIWAGADSNKQKQEDKVEEILTNWIDASDKDKKFVEDYISNFAELIEGYEYQVPEIDVDGNKKELEDWQKEINRQLNDHYQLLDKKLIASGSVDEAWNAIKSRVANEDAIKVLTEKANSFAKSAEITNEVLSELYNEETEVKEFFDYLKTVGLWDGTNFDKLTGIVRELRTGLVELASVNIVDDIETLTNKFDSLNNALSDVAKNGIISLNTLQTLLDKYPTLAGKYFNKTLNGYVISDGLSDIIKNDDGTFKKFSEMSDYEILQDMAITDLKKYKKDLDDAALLFTDHVDKDGKEIAALTEDCDDYQTALKNIATAQDNLNTKEMEWASLLREAAIEDKTNSLEKMQEALEEQLNIYKELIDIRKDLLTSYKEEVDRQKELAKKQKSVADLQTQLALAKLDKSASGQARARELENQLQEAQEELDDYTLERAIEDLTASIDNEYGEYENFINEKVTIIKTDIENIGRTLENILTVVGSSTVNSSSDMYTLYTELAAKNTQATSKGSSMTDDDTRFANDYKSEDVTNFIEAVKNRNWAEADEYYSKAKEVSDSYELQEKTKQIDADQEIANKIVWLDGSRGEGIKSGKDGDNGIVEFGGKKYYVENGGSSPSLKKAAYEKSGDKFSDRKIFWYEGALYGCLDGAVVKLKRRQNSYGDGSDKGYNALYEAVKAQYRDQGVYHTGGFVGDVTSLKSNEEFAKLLNGEFVSTPKQMDNFMKNTLPSMLLGNSKGGATINNNSPLVEIKCGNINEDTLPTLKTLVDQAVTKIGRSMEGALTRTGYKKKF